jgi:hypothetical protein
LVLVELVVGLVKLAYKDLIPYLVPLFQLVVGVVVYLLLLLHLVVLEVEVVTMKELVVEQGHQAQRAKEILEATEQIVVVNM